MSEKRPVLIAGGGPVGLSLALALSRKNIPVVLFEMRRQICQDPRANTFHPPTLEMLSEWGVLDPLLEHGLRVDRVQYWNRNKRQLVAELDFLLITGDTRFPFRLHCPQYRLSEALVKELRRYPQAKIFFEHRVKAFEDHSNHVIVEVEADGARRKVAGAYLCAADGAYSPIRSTLGIDFAGKIYEDLFLTVEIDNSYEEAFATLSKESGTSVGPLSYFLHPKEWVIAMAMPKALRLLFRLDIATDPTQGLKETMMSNLAQRLLGTTKPLRFCNKALYVVKSGVATTFRKGRVILLGDAAHIVNPSGGSALNFGVHDAYHLATALEAEISRGALELISQYGRTRHQDASDRVLNAADESYKVMGARGPWDKHKRDRYLRGLMEKPEKAREHLLRISMMHDRLNQLPRSGLS